MYHLTQTDTTSSVHRMSKTAVGTLEHEALQRHTHHLAAHIGRPAHHLPVAAGLTHRRADEVLRRREHTPGEDAVPHAHGLGDGLLGGSHVEEV